MNKERLPYVHPYPWSDHTYKVASNGQLDLKLRIWPSLVATKAQPKPWFLWCHGGGWIAGDYCNPGGWKMLLLHLKKGYHVVSLSHRFTPQVGIEDIVEDLTDAYAWCRKNLERVLEEKVVLHRFGVGGESAGAGNALMMGHIFEPPPAVIFSGYAPSDFTATPSTAPSSPFPLSGRFTKEEVLSTITSSDPGDALAFCPWWIYPETSPEDIRRVTGLEEYVFGRREWLHLDERTLIASHGRMIPALFKEPMGTQGEAAGAVSEKMWEKRKRWSPLWMLSERKRYPPVYLFHGDKDALVDVGQSVRFKERLDALGYEGVLHLVKGGAHDCDRWMHEDEELEKREIQPVFEYITKHLDQ